MANIVVIDDERNIALVVRLALSNLGHRVETYHSGADGLARLAGGPAPDLVIADLRMPGVGGRAIVAAMRGDPDLAAVPVIILSGCVPTESILPPEGTYDAFLSKPFDLNQLAATVQCLLSGTGQRSRLRGEPRPDSDSDTLDSVPTAE